MSGCFIKQFLFMIEYKGYTIQEDYRNPYSNTPEYMFYPTEQGIDHDADYDGEQYTYAGNCRWSDSLENAMLEIDDLTLPLCL